METTTTKPIITITKQQLFKTFKFANEIELRTQLNAIIYENRKSKPTYKGMTEKKIKATKHIKMVELKQFLQENDIDINYFEK